MTLRYRLRTLLIVLALMPPLLAMAWWAFAEWRERQEIERVFGSVIYSTWLPPPKQL